MLHKEIPFLRIGLPLCAGIIAGLYFQPGLLFIASIAVISITGFLISFYNNKTELITVFGLSFTLVLFLGGLLLYRNEKNSITILPQEPITISGIISDFPLEKEKSYMLKVKMNSGFINGTITNIKGSLLIYCKKDSMISEYLPGDRLIFKCSSAEITNRGNPFEFDYRFFMENQGIKYYAFISSGNIISHYAPDSRKLVYKALIIREKIIRMYEERGIKGDRLALVSAMTLGQKSMLDQEQKQNFMKAGVMHIMAVSGLHAIILSMFIFNILFFLKGKYSIFRILITILILWAFAFVTGLTPSVLRATLMYSFLQAGNLMHRRVNGINSVLASAFILILIKPSVIFDAGFLLSYSAVIYIIMFYQELYSKIHFKKWLYDKIWQSAVITLVAQAGTLPLTIMLFNRFPSYFLITNIVIVPISSLLIITGCLVPLTFPVIFLSKFLAVILDYLTIVTDWLTKNAASAAGASIENIGMTAAGCLLLTIFIFILSYYMLIKPRLSVLYPIGALTFLLTAGTIRELYLRYTDEIIVYNTPGITSVGIRTGKVLNLYTDTAYVTPDVRKHASTLGLSISVKSVSENSYIISTGKRSVFIGHQDAMSNYNLDKTDIAVLTQLQMPFKETAMKSYSGSIILASGVSSVNLVKYKSIADSVHYVKKSGAYISSL